MTSTIDRGPLHGIRVLDFSTVYAGPMTAMLLGDYGADVLKIELPTGDPARTHGWSVTGADGIQHGLWWKVISRNKDAMTLDVRTAEGREILLKLVADADVMTEVEASLQKLDGVAPARDLDELHDLVRTLGPLTLSELVLRSSPPGTAAAPAPPSAPPLTSGSEDGRPAVQPGSPDEGESVAGEPAAGEPAWPATPPEPEPEATVWPAARVRSTATSSGSCRERPRASTSVRRERT